MKVIKMTCWGAYYYDGCNLFGSSSLIGKLIIQKTVSFSPHIWGGGGLLPLHITLETYMLLNRVHIH